MFDADSLLLGLNHLLLGVISCGGPVLVLTARTAILAAQQEGTPADVTRTVERISVRTWHRFNSLGLASALGVSVLSLARILRGARGASTALVGSVVLVLLFLLKLRLDRPLLAAVDMSEAFHRGGNTAVDARHRWVERLSAIAFLIGGALLLTEN